MATVLETLKRKALRGVVSAIEPIDGLMALISAEVEGEDIPLATELPVDEVKRLNLKVGDAIDIFPFDFQTYLIIGKPKP